MRNKLKNNQLNNILWWATAFCLVGIVYIRGADDWERFFLPATLSNYATAPLVANPSYVLFLFVPLSLLPNQIAGAILALINIICLYISSHITKTKKWLLLLSLPALMSIFFGQLDGLVTLGAVIGSVAIQMNNGPLLGGSLLLLGLKPQVGSILIVVYLVWMISKKQYINVIWAIAITLGVICLSFLAFGFWLADWLTKILSTIVSDGEEFVNVSSDIGLFPYGIIFLIIVLLFARRKIPALIVATLLSTPYAGYHSVVAALAFPLPWIIYCITWLPAIIPTQLTLVIVPIGIILVSIYQSYQEASVAK